MMVMKKSILTIIILLVCILCGCQNQVNKSEEINSVTGEFSFTVLKAGQADAILLHTQNHNIVIDCGEKDDGDKIVEYLANNNISEINHMFITHFDKDHIGGFPYVIENINVKNVYAPNYEGKNTEYIKYLESIKENQMSVTELSEDTSFLIDDVLFEISVPKRKTYSEGDNDFSMVISVTHGGNTFLFAGDAEKERLVEVMGEFGNRYDFLKVPHHGKYNKNTKRFIMTVKPIYSVICDSDKNPAENEVISILQSVGSEIYSTRNGNVYVSSNGKEITIVQ